MATTTLTRDLVTGIADYVKRGVAIRIAVQAKGVDYRLFCDWMRDGTTGRGLKADLYREVTRARAEFVAAQQMVLTKHAVGFRRQDGEMQEGDWHAAQEALAQVAAEEELERMRALTTE